MSYKTRPIAKHKVRLLTLNPVVAARLNTLGASRYPGMNSVFVSPDGMAAKPACTIVRLKHG